MMLPMSASMSGITLASVCRHRDCRAAPYMGDELATLGVADRGATETLTPNS